MPEKKSKMQKWYEGNKEKHQEWCKTRVECKLCGIEMNRSSWWNHCRSFGHIDKKKKVSKKIHTGSKTDKIKHKAVSKSAKKIEPKAKPKAVSKSAKKVEPKAKPKAVSKSAKKVEQKAKPKSVSKTPKKVEIKAKPKSVSKSAKKVEQKAKPKSVSKSSKKVEQKAKPKSVSKTPKKVEIKAKPKKTKFIDINKILKKPEDYAPNGGLKIVKGKSELDKINGDENLLKEAIRKLKNNGRVKITTRKELKNFGLGSAVSYITKEGLYRSGGFLKTIQKDYFALKGGTIARPISFPVQFKNIREMYVADSSTF